MAHCANEDIGLLGLFLGFIQATDYYGNENRAPIFTRASDLLTIRDFANLRCVTKKLTKISYVHCRDSKNYVLPFPGLPGVLRTTTDVKSDARMFPHQLASLTAMHRLENRSRDFGELRGGILGDAPGLGKTITMLALIASTAGQRPVRPTEFLDEDGVAEGWQNLRQHPMAKEEMLKALKPIRKWLPENHPLYRQVASYISPPYSDARFQTFASLEPYVRKQFSCVPVGTVEVTRHALFQLKVSLDKRKRKAIKSLKDKRLIWERDLLPTSATLIIAPDELFEHWFQQIHLHMKLETFGDPKESRGATGQTTQGVVYLDGLGDMADVIREKKSLKQFRNGLHVPIGSEELSTYHIVLTTFSRCKAEYKNEISPETMDETQKNTRRPLSQLRWLRIVVDEGHELGGHDAEAGVVEFINSLAAERRWVCSGTPTTGNEDDQYYTAESLYQLRRLLFFLRHPTYGVFNSEDDGEKQWEEDILGPFLAKLEVGCDRLCQLLRETMVMHRKEDIGLPKPIFNQIEQNAFIPISKEQEIIETSKGSGCVSPISILLDQYLHSEDFQSLVDEAQAKYIIKSLELARRGVHSTNSDSVPVEQSRPIKAVVYSSDTKNLRSVTDPLIRHWGRKKIVEMYKTSSVADNSAELARFRRGRRDCRICPTCHQENDIRTAKSGRLQNCCSTRLLEVVSTTTGDRFLIEPERIVRAPKVPLARMEGEQLSVYNQLSKFWKVGDLLEVDIRDPHPVLPRRQSESHWNKHWGAKRCRELAKKDKYQGPDWYFGPLPRIGNMTTTVMEVTLRKWQDCGKFHRYRWYKGPRLKDAPIEQIEEDAFLLSLDARLSHGLDLSFVTHMFLLEPIDDAALLEQVTSRAHRMGATGPVMVDTIHVFWESSATFKAQLTADVEPSKPLEIHQNREKALSRSYCGHCCRHFDSIALANAHERNNCPRNPECVMTMDRHRLSSVYHAIKPPPAIPAAPVDTFASVETIRKTTARETNTNNHSEQNIGISGATPSKTAQNLNPKVTPCSKKKPETHEKGKPCKAKNYRPGYFGNKRMKTSPDLSVGKGTSKKEQEKTGLHSVESQDPDVNSANPLRSTVEFSEASPDSDEDSTSHQEIFAEKRGALAADKVECMQEASTPMEDNKAHGYLQALVNHCTEVGINKSLTRGLEEVGSALKDQRRKTIEEAQARLEFIVRGLMEEGVDQEHINTLNGLKSKVPSHGDNREDTGEAAAVDEINHKRAEEYLDALINHCKAVAINDSYIQTLEQVRKSLKKRKDEKLKELQECMKKWTNDFAPFLTQSDIAKVRGVRSALQEKK